MSRTIATKYGIVRGVSVRVTNPKVGSVEIFKGIPYAMPPIGQMRFKPPGNPTPWQGVRITDRFGPVCPQRYPDIRNETEALLRMPAVRLNYLRKFVPFLRNQSEDCLHLNVYCPGNICY
ncbi:neuroligin-4, X-linked [Caerostris extrusa]|uniref:Neuroligin-4, X-linked n=1 Tax=Caerostris extrusa TaxID=172846 RepID=A0AAV4QBS6_CAEEX|nr:neuroligin-4, X-linked [Caerostris extrusa]